MLASQQSSVSGTTESSPRRARNAPSATAVSAGTGGKTFSSAESAISTRYVGTSGSDASASISRSSTRDGLVHKREQRLEPPPDRARHADLAGPAGRVAAGARRALEDSAHLGGLRGRGALGELRRQEALVSCEAAALGEERQLHALGVGARDLHEVVEP